MRTKNVFFSVLTLLLFASFGGAQVTGVIVDEFGPIEGTEISVEGKSATAVTDAKGAFSIDAEVGDQLVVIDPNTLGKQSFQVTSTSMGNLNFTGGVVELDSKVTLGVGVERTPESVGASIQSFNDEDLTDTGQRNLVEGIQGKVAGADIKVSSSDPGASSGIILRGYGSLSGSNQPLWIVDGVRVNNSSRFNDDLNGAYDFGRQSDDIDPNNVESITVIKGASATALYGAGGANGVIVVTTKKGRKNKLDININSNTLFTSLLRAPNYQDEFGQGWNGIHYLVENGSWGPRFDDRSRLWGNVVNNSQQTREYSFVEDQWGKFFDTGVSLTNSINISGGGEKTTASLTFTNTDQNGIYPGDHDVLERNVLSVGFRSELSDWLTAKATLNYVNANSEASSTGQGVTTINNLLQIPNNFALEEFKDLNNPFNQPANYYTPYGITNPYYTIDNDLSNYHKDRVYGVVDLTGTITDWLSLTYRIGLDSFSDETELGTSKFEFSPGDPNYGSSTEQSGSYSLGQYRRNILDQDVIANMDFELSDNIGLTSNVGFNYYQDNANSVTAGINSLDLPGYYNLANTSESPVASQNKSQYRSYSVYATSTLSIGDYLYFNGNVRNDWLSTLPKDNRSVLFGGGDFAFIFSKFIKSKFLNFGKLRAGYGVVGLGAGSRYAYAPYYVSGSTDNQGFRNLNFPSGGYNAFEVGNAAENYDLKNELRKEFEVGLELEFFKNRIGLDVAYFQARNENQILSLPFPSSTGFTSQTANVGTLENKGIEALLRLGVIRGSSFGSFRWDITANFSTVDSKLVELDDRLGDEVSLGGLSTVPLVVQTGESVALIKGSVARTTDDGRIIVDSNGVPVIDPDLQVYGDTQYDYRLGITNEFSYKGFALDFTFDIKQGGLMYSRTADLTRFTGNSITTTYNDRKPFVVPNSVQEITDGAGNVTYVENSTAVDYSQMAGSAYYAAQVFDRQNVIDKSFVKLREVSLSYTLPNKLLMGSFIKGMTFSVIGRNLFVWTPESNQFIDPELSTFGTDLTSEFGEFSANPSTRSYGFNINIKL